MKQKRTLLLCLLALDLAVSLCTGKRIQMKINFGGGSVDGFESDQTALSIGDEIPKTRFHGNIQGHGNDLNVFKTQRFSRNEDLVINIPVPDGIYTVTLLFAETWDGAFAPGQRVFDVSRRFQALCDPFSTQSFTGK